MMALPESGSPHDEEPQSLIGFVGNEEWDSLLADVSARLEALEQLPDSEFKTQVFEVLQGIDAIHRESLHRLVRLFKEGVLEKVVTDPAIHSLMELYDLLPVAGMDPPAGGKKNTSKDIPIRVLTDQPMAPAATPASVIPHWVPALVDRHELAEGACVARSLDGEELLLCRVDDELFAVDARCAQDGASLAQATLVRYNLVCPQHPGCYYDIRHGKRMGSDGVLHCHPVRVADDGRVLVGFGIAFEPNLPSF